MPKSSKSKIDSDERTFLKELQKDTDGSVEKIAQRCGFSRQKVWRIKKRLEKNKTIWGYNAVINHDRLGLKQYIMLIKKSVQPVENAVNKIIDLTMHKKGEEIGVDILCSSYLHGKYDWMLVFSTDDIKNVKKFSETLIREYQQVISEIDIVEDIFPVKRCGIANPEVDKLKEFF
jgi:DNA-binding Lrp family transcriptional regulator